MASKTAQPSRKLLLKILLTHASSSRCGLQCNREARPSADDLLLGLQKFDQRQRFLVVEPKIRHARDTQMMPHLGRVFEKIKEVSRRITKPSAAEIRCSIPQSRLDLQCRMTMTAAEFRD